MQWWINQKNVKPENAETHSRRESESRTKVFLWQTILKQDSTDRYGQKQLCGAGNLKGGFVRLQNCC